MSGKVPEVDSDEDDTDFVPAQEDLSDEEKDSKKRKREDTEEEKQQEEMRAKRLKSEVDDIWASLKASTQSSSDYDAYFPTKTTPSKIEPDPKTTKVESTPTKEKDTKEKQIDSTPPKTSSLSELMSSYNKPATSEVDYEKYKFAGEEFLVPKSDPSTSGPSSAKKKGGNLSSILSNLQQPKKLSTIQKSSMDWSKFKSVHTELNEELENAKKDGYLEKQSFLQRADVRQFEVEKEIRNKDRTQRNKK
eukprot:TRINITY_DN7258_c0_g1_i1.p1 TRINITY_DN7258_c0_g1~~TRINITY_DN7258_c0_g1_i1.p1  ORF type:complete len:248 (-),score=75.97 TRINITY_DN7258_c0_g1_i1:54-797(-)